MLFHTPHSWSSELGHVSATAQKNRLRTQLSASSKQELLLLDLGVHTKWFSTSHPISFQTPAGAEGHSVLFWNAYRAYQTLGALLARSVKLVRFTLRSWTSSVVNMNRRDKLQRCRENGKNVYNVKNPIKWFSSLIYLLYKAHKTTWQQFVATTRALSSYFPPLR